MRRALVLLAALVAACGGPDAPPDDPAAGVARDPRRIVSTLPGITETVAWLGALDRLVAVSPHCDTPPEVRSLPRVSVMPLSIESIASHAPDLVLVDSTLQRVDVEVLRRRFPGVLVMDSRSLAGLTRSVDALARVLDAPEALAQAALLEARIADLEADVALAHAYAALAGKPVAHPAVLLLAQAEPLHVLGPGSLLDDMLRVLGARNVAADLGRASAPFPMELVRARSPDWILLLTGSPLPGVLARQWADVPAVAGGRVADASADDLVRAGPRTPAAMRRLWQVLEGRLPPAALAEAR